VAVTDGWGGAGVLRHSCAICHRPPNAVAVEIEDRGATVELAGAACSAEALVLQKSRPTPRLRIWKRRWRCREVVSYALLALVLAFARWFCEKLGHVDRG
jgi:hypothetical protein